MGRPERPVDPGAGPVQLLAFELRKLRRESGLTYRELARRSGCSVTALSEAAGGDQLPTLRVTRLYAGGCGADPDDWELRWREAAAEVSLTEPDQAMPPYLGLAMFEPDHKDRFFGRDKLVGELVERLRRQAFLGVFGPSGCGKSSLLRAGLVAAARDGGLSPDRVPWTAEVITPGARPAERLAEAVRAKPRLIVVDQFEEMFTQCGERPDRERFVELLVSGPAERVVLAVRADFYGRCAEHPELAEALRDASLLVGPLTAGELREIIVKPASREGLTVEPALVATIVGAAGQEPGALPHVSHALLETWRQRRGKALTMTGYEAAGGVHGAIARTAERAYTALPPERRPLARQILLRLVALGEGTEDTRRRAGRAELAAADPAGTAQVLELLAGARLITLAEDTVEIAHEAVIGSWPRLRDWLGEDREGLRIHRRLTEAAIAWDELDRDLGALYRGARLAAATDWAAFEEADDALTPVERAFLQKSVLAERVGLAAARRQNRRLRSLAGALTVLVVAALATGLVAVLQRQEAVGQKDQARARQLAAESRTLARTDIGAAARSALRAYGSVPNEETRSALLGLAGHPPNDFRLTGHVGAVTSVAFSGDSRWMVTGGQDRTLILWDFARRARLATLTGHHTTVQSVAFSSDGRLVASGDGTGVVILWDAARRSPLRSFTPRAGLPVTGIGFHRDGRHLLVNGPDDRPSIWDATTGKAVPGDKDAFERVDGYAYRNYWGFRNKALLPFQEHTLLNRSGDFEGIREPNVDELPEPSGRTAQVINDPATVSRRGQGFASWQGVLRSFSVDFPRLLKEGTGLAFEGATAEVRALTFGADERTLLAADTTGTVTIWDPFRSAPLAALAGHTGAANDVAVTPDGATIVSAGDDGIVGWNRRDLPLLGHVAGIKSVAASPDGRLLATASTDAGTRLWDTASRRTLALLSPTRAIKNKSADAGPVNTVAFGPGGRLLATGDAAGVRVWDVPGRRPVQAWRSTAGTVTGVAFSPDGRLLASATSGGEVTLREVPGGSIRGVVRDAGTVNGLRFSPDGRRLAVAGPGPDVVLRTVPALTPATTLTARSGEIKQVAFDAPGHRLAAAAGNGDVLLWDLRRPGPPAVLRGHKSSARAVAFSPDGSRLASGGVDHTIVLWDVGRRSRWATLSGHSGPVTGLLFSPDGGRLTSVSEDHTAILWPVRPGTAVDRLSALAAGRP